MAWSPDALIIVSHKHSWARKEGEGGARGEFQVPNGNSEEGWDTFTVTEPEFGGRLHVSCFAYTIQSFQQLSEIGYSDPRLIAPIHKSEIISCLSETRKDLVEFSIRTSESNAPVPFLSAYLAFCFLSIAVFFHSVGVLHHLEHRWCLANVHRMDVEWLNEYCTNACRTRDPHRRVRVKWLSQLSLLLRRGDVHTWGQRTYSSLSCPLWTVPLAWLKYGLSSPMLPTPDHRQLSCQKTKCVYKRQGSALLS